jgi:uncharacterized protein
VNKFNVLFPEGNPVLGMIHLGGGPRDVLSLALREARILSDAGIDGIIVENYFGTIQDVHVVMAALGDVDLKCRIGINILGDTEAAFEIADRYRADFIQIDGVAGHLPPSQDESYAAWLAEMRKRSDAAILGGVRFKYMPVLSGRSEAEDVRIGRDRCDAVVVTSDATGQETDIDKIRRFREVLGPDHPLLVGAGLTPANVAEQFAMADGGIVGSWLKHDHRDTGRISPRHVEIFLEAARRKAS